MFQSVYRRRAVVVLAKVPSPLQIRTRSSRQRSVFIHFIILYSLICSSSWNGLLLQEYRCRKQTILWVKVHVDWDKKRLRPFAADHSGWPLSYGRRTACWWWFLRWVHWFGGWRKIAKWDRVDSWDSWRSRWVSFTYFFLRYYIVRNRWYLFRIPWGLSSEERAGRDLWWTIG